MGMHHQQHPLVQINDMSKRGHKDSESADGHRRRLQSDEDASTVTAIKKCMHMDLDVGVVCVTQYMDDTVSVEYANVTASMSAGTVETEEWRVADMFVDAAQIYECHDNFEFVESLCVEKWKLDEADVVVVAKHQTPGNVEFALDAQDVWSRIEHFADGSGRRMCTKLLDW